MAGILGDLEGGGLAGDGGFGLVVDDVGGVGPRQRGGRERGGEEQGREEQTVEHGGAGSGAAPVV